MTAIVIVSFGRVALMRTTLQSLFANEYDLKNTTITIVDNGSQSEMISLLLQYRKRIDNLVLLNENRGKPYAWNLGIQVAQERCKALNKPMPDFVLFCDNDLNFKAGWHKKLHTAYIEHQNLPLCALSGLRWPSHPIKDLCQGPTTQINVVRYPPGCCVFMSLAIFKINGPWDTRRLIRTVDTSYFRNANNRGFKNASIHPESVIEHTGKTSRTWHIQTGKPKLLP